MNKYARDIQAIREADATKSILTCHDEYLLASMVQGIDGALVGFATFIPQLIADLWDAVKAGDLKRAMLSRTSSRRSRTRSTAVASLPARRTRG